MNKGRHTHAPYMTLTALNHWTTLLLDTTHWLANSTRELCTTALADGSDRASKITLYGNKPIISLSLFFAVINNYVKMSDFLKVNTNILFI